MPPFNCFSKVFIHFIKLPFNSEKISRGVPRQNFTNNEIAVMDGELHLNYCTRSAIETMREMVFRIL